MIRSAKINDAKTICDIYNYYVTDTIITFEESPVGIEEMESRIVEVTTELPWLVFEKINVLLAIHMHPVGRVDVLIDTQ